MQNKVEEILKINEGKKLYDEACKKILSSKQILSYIMKECIVYYKDIPIQEIPNYIEKEIHHDGEYIIGRNVEDTSIIGAKIEFDLLFTAQKPNSKQDVDIYINIEAQNDDRVGYDIENRAMYYCSRLVDRQKGNSYGFVKSNYNDIKEVYSIWLCFGHSKKKDNDIVVYEWIGRSKKEKEIKKGVATAILLYIPEKPEEEEISLQNMISTLFTKVMKIEKKKELLRSKYDILKVEEIEEEMDGMCNLSDGIYNDGVKDGVQQGLQLGLKQGKTEGLLEGKREGLQLGKREGSIASTVEHVKSLIKSGKFTYEEAIEILEVPTNIRSAVKKEFLKN